MSYPTRKYSDINDVLEFGKYAGKTIHTVVTELSRTYMDASIWHGKIIVTPHLRQQIAEAQAKNTLKRLEREKKVKISRINGHDSMAKRLIERYKRNAKETDEPCIHNKCWCAHKCKHNGHKTCDWQTQVEDGIKEIKERTFKYNIQTYRYRYR